jgi:hypothetical protein
VAIRLEATYDQTNANHMIVESETESLEKMEPNPGEKEAVVERQEIPNEMIAIHSLMACRNERTACKETMGACLECEEPTPAGMKVCQETTACHEATETDTENIQADPRMMLSVTEHQEVPKRCHSKTGRRTEEAA